MRVVGWMYGVTPPDYGLPIYAWWVEESQTIAQTALLLACLGTRLHRALFLAAHEAVYRWASPLLLSFVVLMPVLALLRRLSGRTRVIDLAQETEVATEKAALRDAGAGQRNDTITLFYFPIAMPAASCWCS